MTISIPLVLLCLAGSAVKPGPTCQEANQSGDFVASDGTPVGGRPWGAVALSVVPGIVWPGAGHFVAKDRPGAKKLTWWGLAGLGLAGAGGLSLALTHSSRHATWFPVSALWLGAGGFLTAKFADWFGTATGGATAWAPPTPAWEVLSGLVWSGDGLSDDPLLGRLDAEGRLGAWRGAITLEAAPSGDDRRLAGLLGWTFWRPPAGTRDGSFWELTLGAVDWRFGLEPVRLTTVELQVTHRRDLRGVHPTLAGSFAEGALGFGLELAGYPGMDSLGDRELSRLALGHFAFGVYLGPGRGELALYYDHRHDTRAGGLRLQVSGDGPAGAVGLRGRFGLSGGWYLWADAARGAHWVAVAGVGLAGGGR